MPRASPLRAAPPPSAAGMKKELKELHGHAAAARSASRNSFAMWNTSRWPPKNFHPVTWTDTVPGHGPHDLVPRRWSESSGAGGAG